jgi:transposase
VGHLPLDGNTAEVSTHIENLKLLDQVLPKGNLLVYLADSKLDSEENLLSIKARGGRFLCAGVFSQEMQERYLGLRRKLRKLNYYPESQAKLPAAERDQYKVVETTETIRGEVDGRRQKLTYRQIFVWSEAKARQKKATRERHMGKIREEFETVERNLNKYSLTTREVIVRRLESAKARYSEGELFEYELHQRQGRFSLKWRIDPKKLQRREHLEGAFLLKTNLSASRHSPTKVLTTYRQQSKVEQGHRYLKGPLAVSPTYLEKPERIAGLLCILVWALMVLRLMERNVRRELNGEPLYGLYPENRPCLRPTIPAILECFSTVSIVIVKHRGTVTRRLAEFTPIQHRLIRLMGIPPDGLRSFKRRCAT